MSDSEQAVPVRVKPNAMGVKKKGAEKIRQVPENTGHVGEEVRRMKAIMREQKLHSVCEEASCPNIGECFRHNTASFMIMGDICTRRCPFCDVGHGRPNPLDPMEPTHLAETVRNRGKRPHRTGCNQHPVRFKRTAGNTCPDIANRMDEVSQGIYFVFRIIRFRSPGHLRTF